MGGGPPGQCGGLQARGPAARLLQAVQQAGHAVRVVEGGVGGSPPGQCGGLLARGPAARLLQAVQQAGHGVRVVEGGVGGRVAGQQRGGLLVPVRVPQAVQNGPPASRLATQPGSSRGAWAAAQSLGRGSAYRQDRG